MAKLFAGTSGFAYPSWKPAFYPAGLPSKRFLEHYATRLNSVEANYTFRRLMTATVAENWCKTTPLDFQFGCKAHMRLTHMLKMQGAEEFTEIFLKSLEPLRAARRLGPVLFQFPATFKPDPIRLENYLALLPKDIRFAFEFRHGAWLNENVFGILRENNVAICFAESDKLEVPKVLTADFTYFRLRKAEYDEAAREVIRAKVQELLNAGKDVYVYFKHEDDPQGAIYAEELRKSVIEPKSNGD